jgi:hypothetical protein
MAKRGFLRVSGRQDAWSERPARWHGQPRPLQSNPQESRMGRKKRSMAFFHSLQPRTSMCDRWCEELANARSVSWSGRGFSGRFVLLV